MNRPKYLSEAEIARARMPQSAAGILIRSRIPKKHLDTVQLVSHKRFNATYGAMASMLDAGAVVGLAGNPGTGKTQMAAIYAIRLADMLGGRICDGTPIMYCRVIEMCADLRNNQDGFMAAIKPYTRAKLLILDEVHVRGDTVFELNMLKTVIDRRYGDGLPTLLISNLQPDEFTKSLGESIVDRMHEGGGILPCDWESLRGRHG